MKLTKSHWSDIGDYWNHDGRITRDSDPDEEYEEFEKWQNEFFPDFEGVIFSRDDFYQYIQDLWDGPEVDADDYDKEEMMECAYE